MRSVVILQHRLLHYRIELFERLRAECAKRDIKLDLVHGKASKKEKIRSDEGSIPWASEVKNIYLNIAGIDLLWQPYPRHLRNSNLIVLMQENKQISNYRWIFGRLWSKRKVAYWGHGRNFQSSAPSGIREYWKSWLIGKIDWWFAYTEMTSDILTGSGYPVERITVLNNAIDSAGFKGDLASWLELDVKRERDLLGLSPSSRVGIFCGSLYPDKRIDILLESADLIRKQVGDFHLLVLGDGPSMPQLKEASESRPWLHLLGVRKGREKALYFRMSDVMLNPGLVGLHIVDAFCAALVMFTTEGAKHSPEVVYLKHMRNGVITADSAEAFGQAVTSVLLDKSLLASLKSASLAESNLYTLDNMISRFSDGIELALNGVRQA